MSDLINWLLDTVKSLFKDITEYFIDLPKEVFEGVLGAIAFVFESIPVPEFISIGMQPFISAIDPGVLYFLSRSHMAEALGIIGAGYTFRLLRKLFTLGQW